MSDTIFDKIISGDIPAEIVYQDDTVMAFRDINPQAPVHILVIPRNKVARFSNLNEWTISETGAFFSSVSKAAAKMGLDEKGYRIVLNNGFDGGQEVEYLHAHILGGRKLNWPPG